MLENFNITIFAIIMDKPDKEIVTPDNHLPKQYYLLMKKIEFFCTHHHYGKALLIYDEVHEEADRKIAAALTGFLFKSQLGKTFRHILEMPLFVSSSVTVSIQLADIFAGILRHYYENHLDTSEPSTEFHQWLFELFQKLQSHTENNKQPGTCFIEYGFQKIGKNFSYPISKNENPA